MFSCCERKSQRRNGSAPQTEREVSLHSSASGAHQTDREVSLYSSASGAHQTEREVSLHSRGGKKKSIFRFLSILFRTILSRFRKVHNRFFNKNKKRFFFFFFFFMFLLLCGARVGVD